MFLVKEGPSGASVITSPSYRIEDSSTEGPLGPTVITSPSHRFEDASTESPLKPTVSTSPSHQEWGIYLVFCPVPLV